MKLDELINKYYDGLNENDIHIWKYIKINKHECCNLTIDDLADKCNVSRSTVLRFAQKLSLKGYSELKTHLRWELENENKQIEDNFIEKVCNDFAKSVENLRKKNFDSVCNRIYNAKRVFIHGTGVLQNSVVKEMRRTFLFGHECFYSIQGESETAMLLNTIDSEDLVIIISLTGESEHVINFAKQLKIGNVPIISITRLKNNELARLSDENLYVSTSVINTGKEIDYETTSVFFLLIEVLFLNYCSYKSMMKKLKKGITY